MNYQEFLIRKSQIGGRTTEMLGDGTLEIHHKIPVSEGGSDTPENILVLCTADHKMVHHQRTYLNKHLSRYYTG